MTPDLFVWISGVYFFTVFFTFPDKRRISPLFFSTSHFSKFRPNFGVRTLYVMKRTAAFSLCLPSDRASVQV